ncbi:hypothetical protein [Belliella aquatica]|uniref:Uncharacterized protein n=1 Tax=Belliella aquatica TaxID=1323734 RepID=A0ABQ1N4P4_9BACT|nr:hypothetical protein [Belliella aquatica]MCH7407403.1 hypothetical protein [Belliella aquatica]GGC53189.1 hypothetical protein GCM10010993_34560 [Belliella aquatica]
MKDNDKKDDKKVEKLSEADIEKMELLRKSTQKIGKQLTISSTTGSLQEIDELKQLVGKQLDNPEEKYNIYYKGIRKLLMDHLPKGEDYKQMRDIIYDEKNIFLNLGKRKSDNKGVRGSDGRMTYQPIMNEILDIIISWVGESQNPFEIYKQLYLLNDKHGYPHEEYDTSTKSVANAMLKLAQD